MPELHRDSTARNGLPDGTLKCCDHARAGAPGDVKARNRVARAAGTVAAALRPAHDREDANAVLMQPGAFLARRKGDVGLSPLPRPLIFRPVEGGCRHPVVQRELMGVANSKSPLLR